MTLNMATFLAHVYGAVLRRHAFRDEPAAYATVTQKEKAFTRSPAYALAIDVADAMSVRELNAAIDEVHP